MMPKLQVYAIVRIDADRSPAGGSTGPGVSVERFRDTTVRAVTVVFVVPTMEEAVQQVDRLNKLNAAKSATYFWMATRYYPQGRAITGEDES